MTGNTIQIINWLYGLEDKNKLFDIKEHRTKRSLSQNAYAWELITKLANEMRISKEEMYLKMLKSYGQSEIVSMLSTIEPKGYFKYFEAIGTGIVNSKEFTHYKIFKGSSEFDSKEMSVFIDGIVQECSNLGIPTLTEEQIREMRLI